MTISISNVSKRYGDFLALDRISLEIEEHSLTAILGPSGSGKSTLLRVIAGLETPDEGTVHILGQDVTRVKPQDRGVGFVFQHYAAFKHMTVWENVAFGLKIRRQRKDEIASTVSRLLKLVQLEGYAHRYPSQLSGGQRQRMALARALAIQPRVLLLDEPFGALDAKVRKELRDWLRRLHEEVGVTAVLVTHDQEEAMDAAESIVVMNHGRIEQIGTAMEIYDHPVNDFVMSFIGDVNHIDGRLIRPHHVRLSREPDAEGDEMVIDRLVHLGYAVRADLVGADGKLLRAEMTRDEASDLGLEKGQNVFVSLPEEEATAGAAMQ